MEKYGGELLRGDLCCATLRDARACTAQRGARGALASMTRAMLVLLLQMVAAHPDLGLSDWNCGQRAHPSKSAGCHRTPFVDPSVRISLYMATGDSIGPYGDGQLGATWACEHAHLALAPSTYVPGADHLVLLEAAATFEARITATAGRFAEFGRSNTGALVTIWKGVGCAGQRAVSIREDGAHRHIYRWSAPDTNGTGATPLVAFDATIAFDECSAFSRAPTLTVSASSVRSHVTNMTSAMMASCAAAPAPAEAHPHHHHHGFGERTVWHGWLSVVAWVLVFPLAAVVARYGKHDAALNGGGGSLHAASPAAARLSSWLQHWFNAHRLLGWMGCALAVTGLLLMEVHKVVGNHPHLQTSHAKAGAAAYALACAQPMLAVWRPGKGTQLRSAWLWGHRLGAAATLACGLFAAITGVQKAATHGIERAALLEAALTTALVLWGICALVLEARHWRAAGCHTHAPNAPPRRQLVEITLSDEFADGDDDPSSPGTSTRLA